MSELKRPVRLDSYDNSWFKPGRGLLTQLAWYFIGGPIVRSHFLTSSFLRTVLLRVFGAKVGSGVVAKPGLRVKFPWKLQVGSNTWIGEDVWIDNLAQVDLGSDCCVSQGAYLCTGNHDWSDPAFGLMVRSIKLENGSWAGARSLLSPGVVLGKCAVAAAGSVVFKDIPAFEVHGGNPAAFLKHRTFRSTSAGDHPAGASAGLEKSGAKIFEEAGSRR